MIVEIEPAELQARAALAVSSPTGRTHKHIYQQLFRKKEFINSSEAP